MEQIDSCIVCGSNQVSKFKGEMFPFVVDRMTGKSGSDTQCWSIHCPICDYHGTNLRFNLEEESRYYKEYMSGEYLTHRIAYEGQSVQSHAEYQQEQGILENRKKEIYEFVKDFANENTVDSLLDYGGNHGEGIPDQFAHARCYVLETEIREHNKKITYIGKDDICEPMDLIICSHVLEHVSDINYHMKKMRNMLKLKKFLYVEVPNERTAQSMDGRMFHEHINMFSQQNLEFLFDLHNFDIVRKFTGGNHYGNVFCVLGQAR
jgi:hypothetical protein